MATIAAAVTGRPIKHVAVDGPSLKAELLGAGLPGFVAELLVTFDLAAAKGDLAAPSTAVLDLTGRAPTSVADFLAAHREALVAA